MKCPRQAFRHKAGCTTERTEQPGLHDGGREMNTLHSSSTSAVVTRLHDVTRATERSGADGGTSLGGGRGCVRGAGRQHTAYMTVVDASTGENGGNGGAACREATGERRPVTGTG